MDLYVFGAGQIAEVVAYYFRECGGIRHQYFVVDPDFHPGGTVDGRPVLAWEEAVARADREVDRWFTAMSSRRRNALRQSKAEEIARAGFHFGSLIHPSAQVWRGFHLPPNTIVMENNILQYKCDLGANSILWSSNHIGHHTSIGANTFITSEVVISGSCRIGDNCFFGVNATVFDNVTLGDRVIVGAGSVAREDTPDGSVIV